MTPEERISLVEQLRQPWTHYGKYNEPSYDRLRLIAADEIERMEAALASGSPQVAATALSQVEGSPIPIAFPNLVTDSPLVAVPAAFLSSGPDGRTVIDDAIRPWKERAEKAEAALAALPTRPREQAAKHKWVYHGGLGYTQCAHCGIMRVAAISEDCPREQEGATPAPNMKAKAIATGYSGDACSRCGNFTMRRADTCLVCESCGETTGCS